MDTNQSILSAVDGTVYHGVPADVKAADLVDESINTFSDAPLEFEPAASMLWDDTKRNYYHACTANRFSENYLKLCGQLEKNITQMGKFCLTKAVLETKGMEFPNLSDLNILELVKMVSFHLRKTHAAFEGIYQDNNFFGTTYLNWEFRWFGLNNKLNVTEAKIRKIKEGKINIEKMLAEAEPFKGEKRGNDKDSLSETRALRANPNALPLDRSMMRQMLGQELEEEKEREAIQRDREKLAREEQRLVNSLMRGPGMPKPYEPNEEGKKLIRAAKLKKTREAIEKLETLLDDSPEPGTLTTRDVRGRLLEIARERGDEQALREIPMEDIESLRKRWNHHLEYDILPDGDISAAEVRKILLKDAEKRHDIEALRIIPGEDYQSLSARWIAYMDRLEQSLPPIVGPPVGGLRVGPSPAARKALREKRKKKKK